MLLKRTSGVFLMVDCQSQLCVGGNLLSALGFAVVFSKLGLGLLPRLRNACGG